MNSSIPNSATHESKRTVFLNMTIPLEGASHGEVVSYSTDIPMRYAECFATLADGRTVRLADPRQFLGWAKCEGKRSYLFRNGRRRIELRTGAEQSLERVRHKGELEVFSWPSLIIRSKDLSIDKRLKRRTSGQALERKFVARDGSLLFVRAWVRSISRRIGNPGSIHAVSPRDPNALAGDAQVQ